jgi:hypothetical protein
MVEGEVGRTDGVFRITGRYDGARLVATGSPGPADWPGLVEPDFTTPCSDLVGAGFTLGPPESAMAAINEYLATITERYAGLWWDAGNSVLNIWLVGGSVNEDRMALEELAQGTSICVIGGAVHSEAELLQIQAELATRLDPDLYPPWYSAVNTLGNRVEVVVEVIDPSARLRLPEGVVAGAFIEILEGSVADLPPHVPVRPGDVDLVTSPTRAPGGMNALGSFETHWDPDLLCVFLSGGGPGQGRTLPVWPFGYSADSNPLRIYDFDGEEVSGEGGVIEVGGGYTGVENLASGNACGADSAWIMNGPPKLVGQSPQE